MPKNSRAKGAAGERELAALLREAGYKNAKRGQQFSGLQGDADVVDALPYIHIECKRVERLNVDEAIDQSMRDARQGELPAVFHRKNRRPWLVTMPFQAWMKLYKAYEGYMAAEKVICDTLCRTEEKDRGAE